MSLDRVIMRVVEQQPTGENVLSAEEIVARVVAGEVPIFRARPFLGPFCELEES